MVQAYNRGALSRTRALLVAWCCSKVMSLALMLLRMRQARAGQAGAMAGPGLEPQEGGGGIYRPAAVKVLRMMRREMTAAKIVECAARRLALAVSLVTVLPAALTSAQSRAARHLGAVDCRCQHFLQCWCTLSCFTQLETCQHYL